MTRYWLIVLLLLALAACGESRKQRPPAVAKPTAESATAAAHTDAGSALSVETPARPLEGDELAAGAPDQPVEASGDEMPQEQPAAGAISMTGCSCPSRADAAAAETPVLVAFPGSREPVVLCGEMERTDEAGRLYAGAVEAVSCRTGDVLLRLPPAAPARIEREEETLRITHYEHLPYGPGWQWQNTDVRQFVFRSTPDSVAVDSAYVFDPPKRLPKQVRRTLAAWDSMAAAGSTAPGEAAEVMIYRMLAAALSDSTFEAAERLLRMQESLPQEDALTQRYRHAVLLFAGGAARAFVGAGPFAGAHPENNRPVEGAGAVEIVTEEEGLLPFYRSPLAEAPVDTLVLSRLPDYPMPVLEGSSLVSMRPMVFKLDYGFFYFRCLVRIGSWCEVVLDENTGTTRWIQDGTLTRFLDWPSFLKRMFAVYRLDRKANPIRSQPDAQADVVSYEHAECMEVQEVQGDWMKVSCTDLYGEEQTATVTGWIRWRQGGRMILGYYLLS